MLDYNLSEEDFDKKIQELYSFNKYFEISLELEKVKNNNIRYKNYLAYRYFLKYKKNQKTDSVFKKILKEHGNNELDTYYYLANVAYSVYQNLDDMVIIARFYRKVLEFDNNHCKSLWMLYNLLGCNNSLERVIKIGFKQKDYEAILGGIRSLYRFPDLTNSSDEFCSFIIELFQDDEFNKAIKEQETITNINSFLAQAFHRLERYDDGVNFIKKVNYETDINTLELYCSSNHIKHDEFIYKKNGTFHFWAQNNDIDANLRLDLFNSSKNNKSDKWYFYNFIIKDMFYQECFKEVIEFYQEKTQEDSAEKFKLRAHYIYLISYSLINKTVDYEKIKKYVHDPFLLHKDMGRFNEFDDHEEFEFLYHSLLFQIKLVEYEKSTNEHNKKNILDTLNSLKRKLNCNEKTDNIYKFIMQNFKDLQKNKYINWLTSECKEEKDIDKITAFYCLKDYESCKELIQGDEIEQKDLYKECAMLGWSYYYTKNFKEGCDIFQKGIEILDKHSINYPSIYEGYLKCLSKLDKNIPENIHKKYREQFINSLRDNNNYFPPISSYNFYKYSAFNINTIDSLINHYFYLADKSQLNDPIEFPYKNNNSKSKLRNDESQIDVFDVNHRVCSFSEDENSMLMWSHYSENHKGIMVEYMIYDEIPSGFSIGKMSYEDELNRDMNSGESNSIRNHFLTKNKSWSYEKEHRIFSDDLEKLYYEYPELPEKDSSKLTCRLVSITLGYRFPEDKIALVSNIVDELNNKLSNEQKIILRRASISKDNIHMIRYSDIK